MIIKALGGIGKAIIGLGGSVVKTGAKIFGDDAVEAVGRGVGNAQKGIDNIVQHAVKQDEIYKAAKNKARGIKEATKDTSKAAEEAISKPKLLNLLISSINASFCINGSPPDIVIFLLNTFLFNSFTKSSISISLPLLIFHVDLFWHPLQ